MGELTRANKCTVVTSGDNGYEARFMRTHKEISKVSSLSTEWKPEATANSTANRESFRTWIMANADKFGVLWQPNLQDADTKLPNKYHNDDELSASTLKLVEQDIYDWASDMEVKIINIGVDNVCPLMEYNGREVAHKYAKDNSWAYARIDVCVTAKFDKTEGYASMSAMLVSGQLKKPVKIGDNKYSAHGFKIELAKDIPELIPTPKADDKATESPKEATKTEPTQQAAKTTRKPRKPKEAAPKNGKTDTKGKSAK